MFEMLEDVLNRTRKLAVLLTWIGGAVYVGYQSHFVAMESYDDLLVPAVMGLFIVFLLLAGAALISSQGAQRAANMISPPDECGLRQASGYAAISDRRADPNLTFHQPDVSFRPDETDDSQHVHHNPGNGHGGHSCRAVSVHWSESF